MIPVGDNVRTRSFAVVTYSLIAVNVLVFLFELSLSPRALDAFFRLWAVTPAEITFALENHYYHPRVLATLITSQFLHGGWAHLLGNMLFLWIFGDNVEDAMGGGRFLVFYLLGGVLAALAHVYSDPSSQLPLVGASGAIAAVLGAYFVLHPRASVLIVFPLFLFFPLFEVPAVIVLGFWFVQQLFNGFLSLAVSTVEIGGVAWWAHIGGFVYGMLLVGVFRRRPRYPQYLRYL